MIKPSRPQRADLSIQCAASAAAELNRRASVLCRSMARVRCRRPNYIFRHDGENLGSASWTDKPPFRELWLDGVTHGMAFWTSHHDGDAIVESCRLGRSKCPIYLLMIASGSDPIGNQYLTNVCDRRQWGRPQDAVVPQAITQWARS
jgi:hypothetical protein